MLIIFELNSKIEKSSFISIFTLIYISLLYLIYFVIFCRYVYIHDKLKRTLFDTENFKVK